LYDWCCQGKKGKPAAFHLPWGELGLKELPECVEYLQTCLEEKTEEGVTGLAHFLSYLANFGGPPYANATNQGIQQALMDQVVSLAEKGSVDGPGLLNRLAQIRSRYPDLVPGENTLTDAITSIKQNDPKESDCIKPEGPTPNTAPGPGSPYDTAKNPLNKPNDHHEPASSENGDPSDKSEEFDRPKPKNPYKPNDHHGPAPSENGDPSDNKPADTASHWWKPVSFVLVALTAVMILAVWYWQTNRRPAKTRGVSAPILIPNR
jgi:hypothetical protein